VPTQRIVDTTDMRNESVSVPAMFKPIFCKNSGSNTDAKAEDTVTPANARDKVVGSDFFMNSSSADIRCLP